MAPTGASADRQPLEEWIPLAEQVVRTSLRLGENDVFTIYTYPSTIPLAEALALEARRVGSDTHLTLMTDDLWFTSMRELPAAWLRTASPIERALAETETAHIYLGGPADARRMRDIPPEKMEANEMGNRSDHNFQPECSATTPPVMAVNETRRKPAVSIIDAKALGLGNLRMDSTRY